MGTLREHECTFLIITRSFLLRMRNVSDKIVEKIKTHVLRSITIFPLKQWLRERASILHYMYIACLVIKY